MSKKKITKLADLEQIDGRAIETEGMPSRMDVLFGADGMGKYGTLERNEYENKLESFNTAELRNHAIKAGLIPISSVPRLKKQLLIEFDKYVIAFKNPTKGVHTKISKEKQEAGRKILSILK